MPAPGRLTAEDYQGWLPVAPDFRLAYGPHPQQFGDLYLPQGSGPYPVVILLHGGCWQSRYTLEPLGRLCQDLQSAGVAVWSLEYRRLGDQGGWPATLQDVAAGADFLHSLAVTHRLNLDRVVALGHSAGGHLALWLAGRSRLPETSPLHAGEAFPLRGVLSLAGIPDLAEAAARDLCQGAVLELMGGPPAQVPHRYGWASPLSLMPFSSPQIWINGAADRIVPPEYAQSCLEQARARGGQVEMVMLPEAGHFELVSPGSPVWPSIRSHLLQLLEAP